MRSRAPFGLGLKGLTAARPPPPPPGKEDDVQASDRRLFISHSGCRGGLNLQEGKEYLVMGPPEDMWHRDGATGR